MPASTPTLALDQSAAQPPLVEATLPPPPPPEALGRYVEVYDKNRIRVRDEATGAQTELVALQHSPIIYSCDLSPDKTQVAYVDQSVTYAADGSANHLAASL